MAVHAHDNWAAVIAANPLNVAGVPPALPPSALKYIGDYLEGEFENAGFGTLQSILNYLQRHTRVQNGAWLRQRLSNFSPGACVGSPAAARTHGRGHRYRIRAYNKFAFNAIATYARHWLPARHRHRIPYILGDRTPLQAFPNAC
jgi:hypothetical protein